MSFVSFLCFVQIDDLIRLLLDVTILTISGSLITACVYIFSILAYKHKTSTQKLPSKMSGQHIDNECEYCFKSGKMDGNWQQMLVCSDLITYNTTYETPIGVEDMISEQTVHDVRHGTRPLPLYEL